MKDEWLHYTVLRTASFLAPGDQRADWLREWRSELWYVPRQSATRFCLGAFQDALWLRQNSRRTAPYLESPVACLALLAALAAVSLLIAAWLLGPLRQDTVYWRLGFRNLPAACLPMLPLTAVFLTVTQLVMGRGPAGGSHQRSPGRLRRALFLAVKVILVQPILLCGLFLLILAGPVVPFAPQLIAGGSCFLIFRWLLLDQRRRCPVCLHLLTHQVRIGTPSQTFLEWYGAESVCSRGHGLLQVPESTVSYSGGRQWLRLDPTWSSLFSPTTGARR